MNDYTLVTNPSFRTITHNVIVLALKIMEVTFPPKTMELMGF